MPDTFAATDITCVRGERLVFQDLSFAVAAGGVLLLRGPNGAGKSSLLRVIAGFVPAADGALTWNGQPVAEDWDAHRARLTYVGHLDAVKPAFSVAENLRFWLGLGPASTERAGPPPVASGDDLPRKGGGEQTPSLLAGEGWGGGTPPAVAEALAAFGLGHLGDLPAAYLSAGQRRRLNLARLAGSASALWLLDEPTSSLDDASARALIAVLEEHRAQGGMAIIATHQDLPLPGAATLAMAA